MCDCQFMGNNTVGEDFSTKSIVNALFHADIKIEGMRRRTWSSNNRNLKILRHYREPYMVTKYFQPDEERTLEVLGNWKRLNSNAMFKGIGMRLIHLHRIKDQHLMPVIVQTAEVETGQYGLFGANLRS